MRIVVRPYHFALAYIGALVYGFPSRRIVVIGVTGTKGKTTVVELLHAIIQASGNGVASFSSLRARIGNEEILNMSGMTMPGRFRLQRFLRGAVRKGARYAVIEVTSQGIVQFRHRGIRFFGAVMTNVAPEHLRAHGGFEPYLRAKLDLFWRVPKSGFLVINRDDPCGLRFAAASRARKIWYAGESIDEGTQQWRVQDEKERGYPLALTLVGPGALDTRHHDPYVSHLEGAFNRANMLAAIATGIALHLPRVALQEGLKSVRHIPGRMEWIQKTPFGVVVDYAHTPDSLCAVYTALRQKRSVARLRCVLGAAGGGRDRAKRPEMGRIAAQFCDNIIFTNEDPFDEDPDIIAQDLYAGIPQSGRKNARMVMDRREAIFQAISSAEKKDCVVITGKGSEQWLRGPKGTRIPWDDRVYARDALRAHEKVSHADSLQAISLSDA